MTTMGLMRSFAVLAVLGMPLGTAGAATLTADEAVKIALRKSTDVINSAAGITSAKGGVYSAYGGLVPDLSLFYSRRASRTNGFQTTDYDPSAGTFVPYGLPDQSATSTTPGVGSRWGILNLSSWASLGAARQSLKASRLQHDATRNDVALGTRRQFYGVVQSIKLAEVATGALKRSRDDERRVRAMFEVGSVSKSDLLKAQVATAQAELDSITATHQIVVQRVALATQMGVPVSELGEVDTLLAVTPQNHDEAALLAEAARNRPDLMAADASLRAARAAHAAARMARLPYVTMSGQATFNGKSERKVDGLPGKLPSSTDRALSAEVALNWDIFSLGAVDSRVASARATLDRAQATADALHRNLASEVNQMLLAYNESIAQNAVAQRGLESATENLKLTQEKYNVGSATILELIDAQVQLQTAQSNVVKALAAIRVAEAQINRVRGQSQ